MKAMHVIEFALVIIGGVNWGLVGLAGFFGGANANWNVVHMIFSSMPQVEWAVYILVGLSALALAFTHKRDCKMCSASGSMPM